MVNRQAAYDQSNAKQNRRILKPLMERKRRARINNSLCKLKTMLLETISLDGETLPQTKMEKADILEMTVNFISTVTDKQQEPQTDVQNYRAGFNSCMKEIAIFLESEHLDIKTRLLERLTDSLIATKTSKHPAQCSTEDLKKENRTKKTTTEVVKGDRLRGSATTDNISECMARHNNDNQQKGHRIETVPVQPMTDKSSTCLVIPMPDYRTTNSLLFPSCISVPFVSIANANNVPICSLINSAYNHFNGMQKVGNDKVSSICGTYNTIAKDCSTGAVCGSVFVHSIDELASDYCNKQNISKIDAAQCSSPWRPW